MKNKKLLVLFSAVLIGLTGCGPETSSSSAASSSTSSSQTASSASSSSQTSSVTPSSSSQTSSSEASSSQASSSESSSSEETINYGTKDAPLTIDQAKALCDKLAANTISENVLFVTGYVRTISKDSYGKYTIWIGTTAEGTDKEFEVYSAVIDTGVVTPVVGSKITATGYYEKYNTTYELTYNSTAKVNPTVVYSDAKKEEIVINTIGSLEEPKTVADAYTVIAGLTKSDYKTKYYSNDKYYVKGIVTSISVSSEQYTLDIADSVTSTDKLSVYKASLANNVTAPKIGDDVVVLGHLQNYVGTYEMVGDGDTYVTPSIEKQVTGTTTYSITTSIVDSTGAASENATISELPSEAVLPNTELTFKVTPKDGYRVSVTFNGDVVIADDSGNYKVTSYFKNEIVVTVTEKVTYNDTTVDLNIGTIATANGWVYSAGSTAGGIYKELPTGDENLSVTAEAKEGASNTGKVYVTSNVSNWRLYKSEEAKLNISTKGSHVVKKVTLTFASGNATFNDASITSGTEFEVGESSQVKIVITSNIQISNIKVIYA